MSEEVCGNTEQYYTQVAESIAKRYGKSYTWDVKIQVMGKTGIDMARSVVELLDLPISPEEYYEQAKEEFRNLMPVARILPDTEVIYKNVIADIAKRFGKIYTPNIIAKVIGTPERESSRIAVTEMKLPMSVDDFQKEFNKSSHDQFHNLPLLPGAEKLINHLKYIRIPMAVATSSHRESFELKARPHRELFKAFSHIVCGGDDPEVKHGKPRPDIFLVCASR
nr:unnamed protein product [Callosobruchus chinensis]